MLVIGTKHKRYIEFFFFGFVSYSMSVYSFPLSFNLKKKYEQWLQKQKKKEKKKIVVYFLV